MKLKPWHLPIDDELRAFLVEVAKERTRDMQAASGGNPDIRVSPCSVARNWLRERMRLEKAARGKDHSQARTG